jgi:hypothetical protein
MAKIDTREQLPAIFRKFDRFILPVSRYEYAIPKGIGYHVLEKPTIRPIIYHTFLPFPDSALRTESENVFLDYANSCGLLKEFIGEENLILTLHGRTTTPNFGFCVNNHYLKVDRAQIEIDACYESLDQIVLFEAKLGIPNSFSLRQLYYPFRTFYGNKKKLRSILFCLEPKEKIYSFWEYEFNPYDRLDSINLLRLKQFKIAVSKDMPVGNLNKFAASKELKNKVIPQADDVNKIIEFPLRVYEGNDTSEKMRTALKFVNRQSSYYRQAVETIGLVELVKGNKYKLTDLGNKLLRLSGTDRASFVCKLLLQFPIMNEVFIEILSDKNKVVKQRDLEYLIRKQSNLTGSTISRRSKTIISWFKWIRNNLGIVEVSRDGTIRIVRQAV